MNNTFVQVQKRLANSFDMKKEEKLVFSFCFGSRLIFCGDVSDL